MFKITLDTPDFDDTEIIIPFLPRVGELMVFANSHYKVQHVVYTISASGESDIRLSLMHD